MTPFKETKTYKKLKDSPKNNTPNKFIIHSKGRDLEVLFDIEDFEKISNYRWFVKHNNYVYTQIKRKTFYLHRFLLNPPSQYDIDHINRNPLDNRKQNLRLCTRSQNNMNKNGIRGVSKFRNKWRARIKKDGKEIHLGLFNTFKEALEKRKQVELELFKEFANI